MPSQSFALEICVESVDHAVAAERGGARRIELCSDLQSGGITPSAGFMQTARRNVSIPIHVLIRPRAGDFSYSDLELETMRDDIHASRHMGMDGVVLGILNSDERIDIARAKMLVESARPLPVTFHRAFDLARNPESALEDVIQTGASRILTSGGKMQAMDALSHLARLVQSAKDRIMIMPCGGISSTNVERIVAATSVREIHTSVGVSGSRSIGDRDGNGASDGKSAVHPTVFEKNVRTLVERLESISRNNELAK